MTRGGTTLRDATLLAAAVLIALAATTGHAASTTYTITNDIFPNPDRGYYSRYNVVVDRDFSRARTAGNLVHSYVRLDAFRTSPISSVLLDQLEDGLSAVRSAGLKVILRFSYNFGPYPNSEPDASEAQIRTHLQQLQPVLARHADVITSFEAGFIGAWGEWHTSTNGLDTDPAAKARIRNDILAHFPSDRMVALRYPSDLRAINGSPISASEAFDGSLKARTGNHQDCFLASDPDDWGTWGRDGVYSVEEDKQFIADNGLYAVTGGETCNLDSPRVSCQTAMVELSRFHFSYLNEDYEPGVINLFKQQGCFDEFRRRFGYRFVLRSATYPTSIGQGDSFNLQAIVANVGYASPFNERPAFAVLDGTGGRFTSPVSSDPRRWAPGTDTTINAVFTVPTSVPPGTYRLALWLPDRYDNLRSRPEYSIRFANQGTWDATAGFNVLATGIAVTGPTVTIGDAAIVEGNSGPANMAFPVTLSPASSQSVTVNYATVAQTATSGLDYTLTSGTLTFTPGVTALAVTVPVIGDGIIEQPNEAFLVNLSNPMNAVVADGQAVGTIIDDDTPITDPATVYRLRHPSIGAYLFTVYPAERDSAQLQYGYVFEGNCCKWFVSNSADGRVPLYRLFSSNAGEYFFTIYASERDSAVAQFGYVFEGVAAYCHPASTPVAPTPWYRLRFGNKHLYTIYAGERDSAVNQYGYTYEGVSCFLPPP